MMSRIATLFRGDGMRGLRASVYSARGFQRFGA